MTITSAPERSTKTIGTGSRNVKRVVQQSAIYIAFVGVCIFFSLFADNFLTLQNWENIARQTAMLSIIAIGVTMVLIVGELDLSIGSVMGLSAVVTALLLGADVNWVLAVVIAIAVCSLVGVANAVFTVNLKLMSFLVTLAMLSVIRGVSLVLSGGANIVVLPSDFNVIFATGNLFGIPNPLLFTLAILVGGGFLLRRTVFGRHMYATGGGREAARLAGINTDRVRFVVLVISSVLAALAGVMLCARLFAALPQAGAGTEIDAIAAAVLGGAAIAGGRGSVLGAVFGALLIGVVSNGLVLMGVEYSWQLSIKGMIIILAILVDRWLR